MSLQNSTMTLGNITPDEINNIKTNIKSKILGFTYSTNSSKGLPSCLSSS